MTCFLLRSCLLTFWKRLVYVPSQPLISPWRHRLRSTEQSHIRRHFCRPAFPPASFIWHPSSQARDEAAFLWQRAPSGGSPRLASPRHLARLASVFTSLLLLLPLVEQNDVEATKAAPVLNSAKPDSSAAPAPASASLDDTELKKAQEKCKRQQTEISKMAEENRQLKVRGAEKHHRRDTWSHLQVAIRNQQEKHIHAH